MYRTLFEEVCLNVCNAHWLKSLLPCSEIKARPKRVSYGESLHNFKVGCQHICFIYIQRDDIRKAMSGTKTDKNL